MFRRSLAVGAAAAGLALTASSAALADPAPGVTPTPLDVVGVGSDTTQGVLNHIADAYNTQVASQASKLYSWDATGSTQITPKTGCAPIARPAGSSAGIAALQADSAVPSCVDFARSSRPKKTDGSEAGLAFLALGRDGVSWVSQATTNAPTSLTKAQLAGIYTCQLTTWDQVGGTGTGTIKPYLPQSGSGTRSFWLSALGVTSVGSCVTQGVPENNGAALPNDPDVIAPYSIANYIAQAYKGLDDAHGTTVLRQISGSSPTVGSGAGTTLNPSFDPAFLRQVYNVVKKDPLGNVPAHYAAIFGANGYICTNQNLVSDYGFGQLGADCGAVS